MKTNTTLLELFSNKIYTLTDNQKKGEHSVKTESKFMGICLSHHLLGLCVCTKFHEEIFISFQDVERTRNVTMTFVGYCCNMTSDDEL